MVHDGAAWFGDFTTAIPVAIVATLPADRLDAAVMQTELSRGTSVPAGQSFTASITVSNRGNIAWTPAGGFRLASQNSANNVLWGIRTTPVPSTVSGGGVVVFDFQAAAPAIPGSYNFPVEIASDGRFVALHPQGTWESRDGVLWTPGTLPQSGMNSAFLKSLPLGTTSR